MGGMSPLTRRLILMALACGLAAPVGAEELPPVHPRRNVEPIGPVEARWVRFVSVEHRISPIIDELEVYGPEDPERNLAAAAGGARAVASDEPSEYPLHELAALHDGRYGNGNAYLFGDEEGSWAAIELPRMAVIDRVVWGRDREGRFVNRLPERYRIEVSRDGETWTVVADSERRRRQDLGSRFYGIDNPGLRRTGDPAGRGLSEAPLAPGRGRTDVVIAGWRSEDGLPSNTVTAIAQDGRGFLWLGTGAGLVCFDGFEFVEWRQPEELAGAVVTALASAPDGAVWVATEDQGVWRVGEGPALRDEGAPGGVQALAVGADGTVWAGTVDGLHQRDPEGWRLVSAEDFAVVAVAALGEEGVGYLSRGRLRVHRDGRVIEPDPERERSRYTSLLALAGGAEGELWFGGANSYVGRLAGEEVTAFGVGEEGLQHSIWALLPTRDGALWIGTASGGLTRMKDGVFRSYTTEDGLTSNAILALAEDAEGNLWVGTEAGGLMRVRERRAEVIGVPEGLSHSVVLSMAEDGDGTVWIGTQGGGINRWSGGETSHFSPAFQLDNDVVRAVVADGGRTFFACRHAGLIEMGAEGMRILTGAEGLRALWIDGEGRLWTGGDEGVAWLEGERLVSVSGGPREVNALTGDGEGGLWVSSAAAGLWHWKDGAWKDWERDDGLGSGSVRTLRLGPHGELWVGTNHGLARWREGRLESIGVAEGLPNGVISQILFDAEGHLWAGSNRGIFRLERSEFEAVAAGRAERVSPLVLGRGDGLDSLECTGGFHPAGLRTSAGELWFSTVAGVVRVDPEELEVNRQPARVWVTGAEVDGRPTEPPLVVPPGADGVRLEFTGISLSGPERVQFRYRLGPEEGWIPADGRRELSLTRLPAGRHRLEIEASNSDGLWLGGGAAVPLRVLAPWWRQPWVGPAALVLSAGLAALAVRSVWQRRMREAERRMAVERERSRIARDLHDELGASLTRIALLSDLARRGGDGRSLGEIAWAAREATQAVDSLVWAVNPRHDTLDSLANYLVRFAEDLVRAASMRLRVDFLDELPALPVAAEVRHHLFLSVKEAVHNAVAHSGGETVELALRLPGGWLEIAVRDDGRGIAEPAGERFGHGLGNLRRRMEEVGGEWRIGAAPGGGTEVGFRVPLAALGGKGGAR